MAIQTTGATGIFPDGTYLPADEVIGDALITTHATQGPAIEGDQPVVHVPFVADDATALVVGEGDEITPSEPVLAELTYRTFKVALLTRMSREASTYTTAANLVSVSAQRAMVAKLDNLFLNGQPAPTDPTQGFPIVQPGQEGLTGVVNAKGLVIEPDPVSNANGLDPLLTTLGKIGANGGRPDALIMSYRTWSELLKIKGSDKLPLISRDVANSPTPTIFGLPVVVNAAMPDAYMFVCDSTQIFASASQINVATSDQVFFTSDSVALRLTCRVGWGIIHENRLGIVKIPMPLEQAG